MKGCELCESPAQTFCESDQAHLCLDCDSRVHSANFLVAKHSRTLLCLACHSPTAWQASGRLLPLTVSVCHACFDSTRSQRQAPEAEAEAETESSYQEIDDVDEHDEEYCSEGGDAEDEEDGDYQVVPWSFPPAPPPVAEASSSTTNDEVSTLTRPITCAGLDYEDEIGGSSSRSSPTDANSNSEPLHDSDTSGSVRPHKLQKTTDEEDQSETKMLNFGVAQSRSVGKMITSLRRLSRSVISQDCDPSSAVLAIRRMSGDS